MDAVFLRTRLQAIIVDRLLDLDLISRPFILVISYQYSREEDHGSVYKYYEAISRRAFITLHEVQASGFAKSLGIALVCSAATKVSNGYIFSAGVGSNALCIALKLTRAKLQSFDDGSANVIDGSTYYSAGPIMGRSLGRRILRRLFPEGSSVYFRTRSRLHFTIYPGDRNIIAATHPVSVDWSKHLSRKDRERIPARTSKILLGTVYDRSTDAGARFECAKNTIGLVDAYIPHPREVDAGTWFPNSVDIESPAEAVIEWLARDRIITVYHFNSSALLPFRGHPRVISINLDHSR